MYEFVSVVTDYKFQEPSGFWTAGVALLKDGEPTHEILKFETEPTSEEIETAAKQLIDLRNQLIAQGMA